MIRCSARLCGFDTAEVRTRDAVEKTAALGARDELRALILGKVVKCHVAGPTDKYGRLLATLWAHGDDEVSVNDRMLERWGCAYDGGTKEVMDWSLVPRDGTSALS